MRLACIADVHLDASFAQLPADVARSRRQAIRESFRAALRHAHEEQVAALLVAGDLYEHDRVSRDTANFLRDAFAALAPARVLIAPGNHDWMGPESLYRLVQWSDNVHVFDSDRLTAVPLGDGITLWGAAHLRPAGTPGFLEDFRIGDSGCHLALFHGSERGQFAFQGADKVEHAPFAEREVQAAGLVHAFVGHYHPPIDGRSYTYPGSLEPLRFGEERQGGIVIAEVAPGGRIERARIVVTQTRLWDERVDVGGATNAHEIVERVRAALLGKDGLARVTLTGELDPEVDLRFEDVARSVDGIHVLVRAENLSPAYDLDEIAQEQTVRGQFVRDLLDADLDDALKQRAIVTGLRALEGRDDLEVET